MYEGFLNPLHLLILIFSAAMVFGMPFLAGYFLGRYLELKKSKRPETNPVEPSNQVSSRGRDS
jgi:hypothetical protein